MCIDKDLERGEWKDTVKCYIKPVNSCWWRQKIWNALRKWQSWGRRHKQTHKSAIDRHIDDCGDRQAPFAIAISPHLLSLSLPLSHHLATLTLTFMTLHVALPFCVSNHLSRGSLVSIPSAQSGPGPTPSVHLLPLVFLPEAQWERQGKYLPCLSLSLAVSWLLYKG